MVKRVSNSKSYVLILLAASLIVIGSCKKSAAEKKAKPTEQPAAAEVKAEKKTAEPAAKQAPKLEPLPIVLPQPVFKGTPANPQVPNLEKPLGKPRPPFYAPAGAKNVALGKPVASTDDMPIIGEIPMITDGDKEAAEGSYVELGPMLQHVTIDLGGMYDIYAILFWHYHSQARVYFDVVVQLADDAKFTKNVRAVFNNDNDNSLKLGAGTDKHYVETAEGKLVDARGSRARYVRLYSNGNTTNELNHYIEVEVFGAPILQKESKMGTLGKPAK